MRDHAKPNSGQERPPATVVAVLKPTSRYKPEFSRPEWLSIWGHGMSSYSGSSEYSVDWTRPILNVATPPKNKAERKRKKQKKYDRGAEENLETVMEEKANRKAKKKVRHKAKGKTEREANVWGGSESYYSVSRKDRQVDLSARG